MGPPLSGEDDAGYVCPLSADAEQQARRELREDPATREHALRLMRDWLAKHPDIRNCRTDNVFLLRFLRTKKFSVPQAQELLERYLAIRQSHPHWFQKLDASDSKLLEIIDSGYLVPLPERDCFGRQIILTCAGRLDPHKYTSVDMARVHSLVVEVLMDDEESQVCGVVHVNDESGLSMSHVSMWSLTDIRTMMRCIQKSTPMRLKGTHFINLPSYASKVFEFFLSSLNEKLRSRIQVHKSLEELKQAVDPKLLPKEYGGIVPMADMIAQFKEKLKARGEIIKSLEAMYIRLHPGSKLNNDVTAADDALAGVTGSFRKLEVD